MKYYLSLIALFLFSFNVYCSDPTTLNFCTNTSNTITLTDLSNCNEFIVSDPIFTIQTLTVSFMANGNYYEHLITGNIIPQAFITDVQNYSPEQIIVENIILIDSNNNEKNLKPLTFKVTN